MLRVLHPHTPSSRQSGVIISNMLFTASAVRSTCGSRGSPHAVSMKGRQRRHRSDLSERPAGTAGRGVHAARAYHGSHLWYRDQTVPARVRGDSRHTSVELGPTTLTVIFQRISHIIQVERTSFPRGQISTSYLHKCCGGTALRKDKSGSVGRNQLAFCMLRAAVPVRCTSLEACESDFQHVGLEIMAAARLLRRLCDHPSSDECMSSVALAVLLLCPWWPCRRS